MSITEAQIAFFQEHGYLIVPEFFNEREIAAMRAELDRFKREGLVRNVATDGDGKTHSQTKQNLQLCPMSPHSALFRAMPFAPQVVEAVRALLGDPVMLHLDQVFIKPGKHGSGTNWHQDNAYFGSPDPIKATALWTAIHDATLANGTLELIPDAFATPLEHSRDPESDHHIRCYPEEAKAIAVEIPAGGVVFFAYGTPHCTRANTTDQERAGVALHFFNADYMPTSLEHESRGAMKHPYLSGPQADGGLATYGIPIAGTWDEEVERTLGREITPVRG